VAERVFRCAVYTRKSTEDGLEQEFNSLDAQYAACAAYALSQKHEGWVLNPERYDDGGFSGGNMERPGLKRLMADVASGNVDIILLYKIDRLTRSLADFAKIVEVLDKAEASFVSITQSFNTTTSMGRLTLNMLLSFAQFEREVTGERIRDKIAASKRRGMWMGGPVPLGYDVIDRKLVPNEAEAELVRHIMRRYLALGSVLSLEYELVRDGHRTKVQVRTSGPHRGGCLFRRGTLYHLLSNQMYRGKIVHKGEYFDGEHEPIVSQVLWDEVQAALSDRAQGHSRRLKAKQPSLLVAMLIDGEGRAMTSNHATKSNLRYRYYVTRPDLLDGTSAWRVSAHDLEKLVCGRVAELLVDRQLLCAIVGEDANDAQALSRLIDAGDVAAATLRSGSAHVRIPLLQSIVQQVILRYDAIDIAVGQRELLKSLGQEQQSGDKTDPILLTCRAVKVRRGHQLRLLIPGPGSEPLRRVRDEKLVMLIAEAHAARQLVMANPGKSLAAISATASRCRTRLRQLLSLACMAPDIVTAIVEGRQPPTLTARSLLATELPVAWPDQQAALGFS
jgi:site-specific DNA recombinase